MRWLGRRRDHRRVAEHLRQWAITLAGYIWPAALRFLRERPNAGDGGGELAGVERQERRPAAEVECVAGRAC